MRLKSKHGFQCIINVEMSEVSPIQLLDLKWKRAYNKGWNATMTCFFLLTTNYLYISLFSEIRGTSLQKSSTLTEL